MKKIESENKIAIYCRVSTGFQKTDRQRVELLKKAENMGMKIPTENIYEDVISGFSKGETRPEYSRLMDDVERGKINEIWFHEMTRMARSSVELLKSIRELKDKGIKLYYHKQNITVDPYNNDIGQQILLSVLSVTAEYEVTLFAQRSLSGKVRKIQEGYGITADSRAYGYEVDGNKKMIINKDEAEIVKRIFEMYANGISTLQIADTLNSEGIVKAIGKKGVVKWRPNTISRMLNSELYKGHRFVVFHEPIPNEEVRKRMLERGETPEVSVTFDEQFESLRIVDDVTFQRVQDRLKESPYNKENATKHSTLLIKKMRCGECGSNFTVGKNEANRTYRCYGRVNRSDKHAICDKGAEVSQLKLDGLVLQMSLRYFAQLGLQNDGQKRINELNGELSNINAIIHSKQSEIETENTTYKNALKRLMYLGDNDAIVNETMMQAKAEHDKRIQGLEKDIKKYTVQVAEMTEKVRALKKMADSETLYKKADELWNNPNEIKNMVDEFIESIEICKMDSIWQLVVVRYVNGLEFWGKIKTARYKKDELFFEPMLCKHGVEYQSWVLNNGEKCFSYDKAKRTITYNGESKIYTAFEKGEYHYKAFNEMIVKTNWMGSFPQYDFDMEMSKHTQEQPTNE